jgi:hypothetical protein
MDSLRGIGAAEAIAVRTRAPAAAMLGERLRCFENDPEPFSLVYCTDGLRSIKRLVAWHVNGESEFGSSVKL